MALYDRVDAPAYAGTIVPRFVPNEFIMRCVWIDAAYAFQKLLESRSADSDVHCG
jgi:hypothetical protein